MQLSSKTRFSTFLLISCSNVRLNHFKVLRFMEIVKPIKFEGVWDELNTETVFREKHSKIFETKSSFHVK